MRARLLFSPLLWAVTFVSPALLFFGLPSGPKAYGQSLIWESQGLIDEKSVPSGSTFTYNGATVTVTWSVTSNGGMTTAPSFGEDYVTYESGMLGNHTGLLQLSFDNDKYDKSDYITITFSFSTPQTGLYFSILDIDAVRDESSPSAASWDDMVDLHYNSTVNVRANTSLWTYAAPVSTRTVVIDNEPSFTGWEGRPAGNTTGNYSWEAPDNSVVGNLNVNLIGLSVSNFTLTFRSTDDWPSKNPAPQTIGISDLFLVPESSTAWTAVLLCCFVAFTALRKGFTSREHKPKSN